MTQECIPVVIYLSSSSPNHSFNLVPTISDSWGRGPQINEVLGLRPNKTKNLVDGPGRTGKVSGVVSRICSVLALSSYCQHACLLRAERHPLFNTKRSPQQILYLQEARVGGMGRSIRGPANCAEGV